VTTPILAGVENVVGAVHLKQFAVDATNDTIEQPARGALAGKLCRALLACLSDRRHRKPFGFILQLKTEEVEKE